MNFCWTLPALLSAILLSPTTVYASDRLFQIYQDALESDPQLKSEYALYHAEQERSSATDGQMYPSVVLTGEIARNREDVESGAGATGTSGLSYFDSDRLEMTIKQPLYRKDIYSQVDRDRANSAVAEAEYHLAMQSMILRVVDRYFELLTAVNELDYTHAEEEAIGKQLKDVKRRYDVGSATRADLYEAQATYDLVQSKLMVADTSLHDARDALREVTDQVYGELADIPDDFTPGFDGPHELDHWLQAADDHNPELLIARKRIESSRYDLQRATSGHYPELDVVAKYSLEDTGGRFGESETDDKSITLQLRVPLYEGGRVNAEVRENNDRLTAEKERYKSSYRKVRRSVSTVFRTISSSISQVKALKQAQTSAAAALEAIRSGYEAGSRTVTDLLDAQRELFRAGSDHMQMQYQFIRSYLELKALTGKLSEEDIRQVDGWLQR